MSFGPPNKKQNKVTYVANNNSGKNQAVKYTSNIIKSENLVMHNTLSTDYQKILNGGCVYLPNFFCKTVDLSIFDKLKFELNTIEVIDWNHHSKCENPTYSPTFNDIAQQMAKHFNVEVLQTRLNYYKDGNDWKTMHKDRHAYGEGDNKIREDFTMGASFGTSRNLDFQHEESNLKFSFPQNNGDVFAFNADVNKKFLHGIPKVHKEIGDRFSIIAWGIRK